MVVHVKDFDGETVELGETLLDILAEICDRLGMKRTGLGYSFPDQERPGDAGCAVAHVYRWSENVKNRWALCAWVGNPFDGGEFDDVVSFCTYHMRESEGRHVWIGDGESEPSTIVFGCASEDRVTPIEEIVDQVLPDVRAWCQKLGYCK